MDKLAKTEIRDILANLLANPAPAFLDNAVAEIVEVSNSYRTRRVRLTKQRRKIEAEIRMGLTVTENRVK